MSRWYRTRPWGVLACMVVLTWGGVVRAGECEREFDSTFDLIQAAIFENRGCTDNLCHGSAVSGGLDLRAGAAYEALIDKAAETVPGWQRVVPGQKDQSLLFLNLAAKTLPAEWRAPRRAMPPDLVPALSVDELEALRAWIEYGAPRDGVVPGTGDRLNACLPPPRPIEITPLPPPPAGEGVQIHMPRWVLPARSEDEVCYASYYDVTDQVPAEFLDPTGTMFRIKRSQIRQDPLSHHMISSVYDGTAAPDDPSWGAYHCSGGPREGDSCSPTELGFCGEGGECSTSPVSRVACIGYGPADASFSFTSFGITGLQETAAEFDFADGVYFEMPLKGTIVWNSHAFNLTEEAGKLEAWLNLEFAAPEDQLYPVDRIFDVSQIFKMTVPAFETEEVCHFYRFPRGARVFELSSHMHKRGKRFRVWEGEFACAGGPNAGTACPPTGPDFSSSDLCAGAPCESTRLVLAGDCDGDKETEIHELVTGVRIALGLNEIDGCRDMDLDSDGAVKVNELVAASASALTGERAAVARDADASMLYLSLIYNDPLTRRFEPELAFDDSERSQRTLTYCALYDNGYSDPTKVKRRSTSPAAPGSAGGIIGGPCRTPTHCAEGLVGEPCTGNTDEERDASCDSATGAGDGSCDACTLRGGVTTEDEMFVLFGAYFVP